MSDTRHFVLGTAGHIDHGKTSLVKLLTGVDCDRLEEEKRRGITIELGFAPWTLDDGTEASIIDVPGHERLVRTMVAGAGGMDLAMLVIAADDGVMPQTREHLDVLELLGVPAGVIVLTKCDLLGDDAEFAELLEDEIRTAVEGTIFSEAPILRTSAKTEMGVAELRKTVIERAAAVENRTDLGPAFLPLDRLFTKAGYGTIGTGTTLRGTLSVGDDVQVFGDSGEPINGIKVRGLQALGTDRETVTAGMRTAVNLAGKGLEKAKRGSVVANAGSFVAVDSLITWVKVLGHAKPLTEETLSAHMGTTEREARVIPLGQEQIEPGESGGVLLRFDRPVAAYAGQRLVLRRPGVHGQATAAGGEILDPEPPRGKGSVSLAAAQLGLLRGTVKERLLAVAKESRAAGVSLTAISRRMPPGEGERTVRHLDKKGKLLRVPGADESWIDGELADTLVRAVVSMVNTHHDNQPMAAGMPEKEIESQLPPPEQHLAATLIDRAVSQKKLSRDGAMLSAPGRGSAVDAAAKEQMDRIRVLYREGGNTPPQDKELTTALDLSPKRVAELMSLLRRQKDLIKVADGLHYDAQIIGGIETAVLESLGGGTTKTASELKPLLGGVSRKYAIPLLEYLDRQKITLRKGDVRSLHPTRE